MISFTQLIVGRSSRRSRATAAEQTPTTCRPRARPREARRDPVWARRRRSPEVGRLADSPRPEHPERREDDVRGIRGGRGRRGFARAPGKLTVSDFEGTTISNPGTLGTTASVPRLMPGQGLIVATGAIGYPAECGDGAGNAVPAGGQQGGHCSPRRTTTASSRARSREPFSRESKSCFSGRTIYESIFRDLRVLHPAYKWAVDRNPGSATGGDREQARVLSSSTRIGCAVT